MGMHRDKPLHSVSQDYEDFKKDVERIISFCLIRRSSLYFFVQSMVPFTETLILASQKTFHLSLTETEFKKKSLGFAVTLFNHQVWFSSNELLIHNNR